MKRQRTIALLLAVGLVLVAGGVEAAIVTSNLSLHYRADDVEIFKWKAVDAVGFLLAVVGVFAVIGVLYLLLNIGG